MVLADEKPHNNNKEHNMTSELKTVIINAEAEGYLSVINENALKAAEDYRSAFPAVKRLINISTQTLASVDAAFKTGSGLYSAKNDQIIASSVYDLSKVDLALAIVEHDTSRQAVDRAAFEIARDAFVTGKTEQHAATLAAAINKSTDYCLKLINKKLASMSAKLAEKTSKTKLASITPISPEAIRDDAINNGGKMLVATPTAYGKTSVIIEPAVRHYIEQGKKVLVISHRRSINKNICADIPGMVSYDECTHPSVLANASGLKIVVNSLSNIRYQSFLKTVDLVVIDEASQVISHVLSGGEMKDREDVWNTLNFVVKNVENVILADADINQRCVDLVGSATAKYYKAEQKHSDITVRTGELDQVRAMAIAAVQAGETVLISCDVARDARGLAKRIQQVTGVEPLVITAENAKWAEQAAFIANPNSTAHQVVIYSPVITSALSITSGHFKRHFGLFSGQIVPSDSIQMMRRDRKAKAFVVGLSNPQYRKVEMVDVEFQRELMGTKELLASMMISDADKQKIIDAVEKDTKPSAFKTLRYEHCGAEAWLKDNIQNTLPATLLSQGFVVEVLDCDDDLIKQGFVARSQGRKAVKRESVKQLLEAKPAPKNVVSRVKDNGSGNDVEHAEVIRARAEEVIGRKKLTEADAKIWGEGEGERKITLFRKMFNEGVMPACEHAVIKVLLPAVREMVLTKEWRSDDSGRLYDQLNAIRTQVIASGISIANATSDKAKQGAVTKVLGSFGLKTKRIDGGKSGDYYIITEESLAQMLTYC